MSYSFKFFSRFPSINTALFDEENKKFYKVTYKMRENKMKKTITGIVVLAVSLCLLIIFTGCDTEQDSVSSAANQDTLGVALSDISHNIPYEPLTVDPMDGEMAYLDPKHIVLSFEEVDDDIPDYNFYTQHALIDFKDISWDNDGIAGGYGFGVYKTVNSIPFSGSFYVINRHGINNLGFTFPQTVHFKGAAFARASLRYDIPVYENASYSAKRVRYHFYDEDNNLLETSEWFDLSNKPEFFKANIFCKRVVVEHDTDYPFDNVDWDIVDAEWYAMDDITFILKPNISETGLQ